VPTGSTRATTASTATACLGSPGISGAANITAVSSPATHTTTGTPTHGVIAAGPDVVVYVTAVPSTANARPMRATTQQTCT
jgi:hypothetical protein